MKAKKGFKVTDKNMECKGFQFELGKEFNHEGKINLCKSGFHFCKRLVKCFNYYDFNPKNRVFEIEHGEEVEGDINDKMVTNSITLVKELSWEDVLKMVNIGVGNSGYNNSGDRNLGHRNSGGWNSGCGNSGYLNTDNPKLRIFNKHTDINIEDITFPDWMYFETLIWIDWDSMNEDEKIKYKHTEISGGYLKELRYKEAAQLSYNEASTEDQNAVELLPNYDADILFEIFGIDRRNK